MSSEPLARPPALTWRTLEWWGAGLVLVLQSGAFLPLLMSNPDGSLGDSARSRLTLVSLPIDLVVIGLLLRHPRDCLAAMRRNLPLVLLILLAFLSIIWSVSPAFTVKRCIGLTISLLVSCLLAVRFTPHQLLLLLGGVLGFCMIASLLLLGGSPRLALMPMESELRGVFLHKNVMGWAASLSTMLAFMMVVDRHAGLYRLGTVLLPASLLCLVLSGSMTSMLAASFSVVLAGCFLLLARTRGTTRLLLLIVFPQIAVALLVVLSEFLVPFLEAVGKDATLTGRVPLWRLVDVEIGERILFGWGFSAFWSPANGEAWRIWELIGWMAPHSHSGYREIMLGLGVIGLAVLSIVILRALVQGVALQFARPDGGWLWLNVLIGMVLIMNLSEALFLAANDMPWVMFVAAIIMISYRYPERHSR